jgi:hypothetical protein
MLFYEADFVSLAAASVTFPKPPSSRIVPNGKRIVFVIVKRTARAFLCVLAEPELIHQFWKRQLLLRVVYTAHRSSSSLSS